MKPYKYSEDFKLIFRPVINLIEAYLAGIQWIAEKGGIIVPLKDTTKTFEDRIEKIDQAKKNLGEAIAAMDALKLEAEQNKIEFERTIEELNKIKGDKTILESEYHSLKQLSEKDVQTIKKIIGAPNVNKERAVGFLIGVVSSLVASGLIWWIARIVI
jgi:hypothetical protein